MTPLSPKRRSELRAEAHRLSPVVIIGDKGLTDEVIAEIDRSLKAHELIKVRAATDERDARAVWIETICDRLEAHPVQQIGKIFVIYRENPKEERRKTELDPGPSPRERGARDDGEGKRRPRAGGSGDEDGVKRRPRLGGSRDHDEPQARRRPRAGGASQFEESKTKRRPRAGSAGETGTSKTKRRPRAGSAGETGTSKTKRRPRSFAAAAGDDVKRTSRPRSRTPSPRPASAPPRRRRKTSR